LRAENAELGPSPVRLSPALGTSFDGDRGSDHSARSDVQLRSITMRFVLDVAWALAMPFSESSMIHIVIDPSGLRPALLIEFELTDERVPLPNFGFSP
jgi:hypothetical protein